MYIYASHLGGLYTDNCLLDLSDLYCEECGDFDEYIGRADTAEEAWELLKSITNINDSGGLDYDYVQEFIRTNW